MIAMFNKGTKKNLPKTANDINFTDMSLVFRDINKIRYSLKKDILNKLLNLEVQTKKTSYLRYIT